MVAPDVACVRTAPLLTAPATLVSPDPSRPLVLRAVNPFHKVARSPSRSPSEDESQSNARPFLRPYKVALQSSVALFDSPIEPAYGRVGSAAAQGENVGRVRSSFSDFGCLGPDLSCIRSPG